MSTVSQSTYFMWVGLPSLLCAKLSNIVSQRVVVSLLSGECVSPKNASVNLGPISRWSLTAVGTFLVQDQPAQVAVDVNQSSHRLFSLWVSLSILYPL